MTDSLRIQCELLTENQLILKKHFRFESAYMLQVVACIYASAKALADPDKIAAALSLIKSKTGVFSHFRSSTRIVLAAIISLDPEPEKLLDKVLDEYSKLKLHFRTSTYLPLTACLLVKHGNANEKSIKEYFSSLKPLRPIFGLENDVVFATLYTVFGKASKYTVSDVEFYTKELSQKFPKYSSKIAARILALGETRGLDERFCKLKELLDESNVKIGKGVEMASLAPFALLDTPIEEIEEKLWEFLDHFEKASKNPKLFYGKQRTSFAAWLLYGELIKNTDVRSYELAKDASFSVLLANAVNMTAAQHSAAL